MRKKWWMAVATGGLLAVGVGARAQTHPSGAGTMDEPQPQRPMHMQGQTEQPMADPGAMKESKADEAKKHLGEVDVYLKDAENNVRILYQSSELSPGNLDSVIQKESLSNLDRSITAADKHVQHLKTLPEARVKDPNQLAMFDRSLGDVKTHLTALRTAVRSNDRAKIRDAAATTFTLLTHADDAFAKIADTEGFTRVERIQPLERQPVRGTEPAPSKHGTQKESPSTTPMGVPEQGGSRY
jgi:hypothetical protein